MHKLGDDRLAWGQWALVSGVLLAGVSLTAWSFSNLRYWPAGADSRRGSPGYGVYLDHYHHLSGYATIGLVGIALVVATLTAALSGFISGRRQH